MAAPVSPLPRLLAYPRPELFTAQTATSDLVKRLRPWPGRAGGPVAQIHPGPRPWGWVPSSCGIPRRPPGDLPRGTGVAEENWGHSLTTVISHLTPRVRATGKERRGGDGRAPAGLLLPWPLLASRFQEPSGYHGWARPTHSRRHVTNPSNQRLSVGHAAKKLKHVCSFHLEENV